MPDITMCMNNTCLLNKKCYRYTATPNKYRQSYSIFKPLKGECEHYLKQYKTKTE